MRATIIPKILITLPAVLICGFAATPAAHASPIAFVSPAGQLTTFDDKTGAQAQPGGGLMPAPGTSPTVATLFPDDKLTVLAFESADHILVTIGPNGDVHNTHLAVWPGSRPSITGVGDGSVGWVITYVDSDRNLCFIYQNPNFTGVSFNSWWPVAMGTYPTSVLLRGNLQHPTTIGIAFANDDNRLVYAWITNPTSQVAGFDRIWLTARPMAPNSSPWAMDQFGRLQVAFAGVDGTLYFADGDGGHPDSSVQVRSNPGGFSFPIAPGSSPVGVNGYPVYDHLYAIHTNAFGGDHLWVIRASETAWQGTTDFYDAGFRMSLGSSPAVNLSAGASPLPNASYAYQVVARDADTGLLRTAQDYWCRAGDPPCTPTVSQLPTTVAPGTDPAVPHVNHNI